MALILREELYPQCVSVGRQIEKRVREGGEIYDEEMEKIFGPLLEIFEKKAGVIAQKEVDEYQGQIDDRKEKDSISELVSELVGEVSELGLYSTDGGDTYRRVGRDAVEQAVRCWDISITPAKLDITKVSNSDVFGNNDVDDDFWDDYLPTYTLDSSTTNGQEDLVDGDISDVGVYIKNNAKDIHQMLRLLKDLDSKGILKYSYYISTMIETCSLVIDLQQPLKKKQKTSHP